MNCKSFSWHIKEMILGVIRIRMLIIYWFTAKSKPFFKNYDYKVHLFVLY